MGVAGHDGVEVLAGEIKVSAAQIDHHLGELQVDLAGVDTDFRCKKVIAATSRMLLASDFQPREFDEVALEIEVQIFNIRVDFERRVIFLFFRSERWQSEVSWQRRP